VRLLARERPPLATTNLRAGGRTLGDLLEAARAGRATGLVPSSIARAQPWPGLAFVEVADIPPSPIAIAWRSDHQPRAVRDIAALAAELSPTTATGPPSPIAT
jgi:DNA-binding transcriptional LysR family regulator